eukprot:scaffold10146_cov144-Isochrysis_galbana.AAC.4
MDPHPHDPTLTLCTPSQGVLSAAHTRLIQLPICYLPATCLPHAGRFRFRIACALRTHYHGHCSLRAACHSSRHCMRLFRTTALNTWDGPQAQDHRTESYPAPVKDPAQDPAQD